MIKVGEKLFAEVNTREVVLLSIWGEVEKIQKNNKSLSGDINLAFEGI